MDHKNNDLNIGKGKEVGPDGKDLNRDPLSGSKGAHPVGTGIGAAIGGAATGAAVGAVAGPVGAAIGAVAGAVAGGYAGKGIAEAVDPTTEDKYWSEHYKERPYAQGASDYREYQPAYRYGWENASRYRKENPSRRWDDVSPELERNWDKARGNSELGWDRAKDAVRDAWDRVIPGDQGGSSRANSDQRRM